jgi:hypothetical protein
MFVNDKLTSRPPVIVEVVEPNLTPDVIALRQGLPDQQSELRKALSDAVRRPSDGSARYMDLVQLSVLAANQSPVEPIKEPSDFQR